MDDGNGKLASQREEAKKIAGRIKRVQSSKIRGGVRKKMEGIGQHRTMEGIGT